MGQFTRTVQAAERHVLEIAREQLGVVTREQALAAGMSLRTIQRRVWEGAWEELLPGVFVVSPGLPSHRRTVKAATLWIPGSAGSHRFAGAEWELDAVPAGFVEITSPVRAEHRLVCVHRSSASLAGQVKLRYGIPITDPIRTLLDLGALLPIRSLELAFEDALRRGLLTVSAFEQRFDEWTRQGRTGATAWRSVMRIRDRSIRESHTGFERRLMQLIRRSDLPQPVAQHRIREGGRFVARPDAAYPEYRIAIEAQSARWHLGREKWAEDLQRQTRLAAAGWLVLYFTYQQLRQRPDYVVGEIRKALLSRGWVPRREHADSGA